MAVLGVCYQLLWTNLGDGILCTLSPNHNIQGGNGVYQQQAIYALKSKGMLEMHFPFDLANSKKTQSLGENGCRQKCLEKSLM